MSRPRLILSVLAWCLVSLMAAHAQTTPPVRDAGGFPAPTAALERGRTVYVLNTCHFCHGIDLTGATMGAADLMHSPLVGPDRDGDVIGAIVKAGLPNLQTAMPAYRDLTPAQIVDLARYIHFLRQQGMYTELRPAANQAPGDAAAGRQFFYGAGACGTCHSPDGDLIGLTRKYDAATLRSRLLRPGPALPAEGATASPGLAAHLRLLENYTAAVVENILAYLRGLP